MSALRQPDFDRYYSPAPQYVGSPIPEKQITKPAATPSKIDYRKI